MDKDTKQYDRNNDGILWRYKKSHIGFFISVLLLFSLSIFCSLVLFKGVEKYLNRNDTDFFMILLLLIATLICLYPPYRLFRLLNQKDMFIAKDKLFIEKYLGKTIILPLGTFYVSTHSTIWGFTTGMTLTLLLYRINPHIKYSLIAESSFIVSFGADNLDGLYSFLLPKIEAYLLTLEEKDYINCKISINSDGRMNHKIDFEKIDKLREERENGK